MDSGDEAIRVQLARMEGKLDLSNEKHDQANRRLDNHEQRLHRHSNDISTLQAKAVLHEGQRQGFGLAVKIGYALGGSGVMGMIALIARHFAV